MVRLRYPHTAGGGMVRLRYPRTMVMLTMPSYFSGGYGYTHDRSCAAHDRDSNRISRGDKQQQGQGQGQGQGLTQGSSPLTP